MKLSEWKGMEMSRSTDFHSGNFEKKNRETHMVALAETFHYEINLYSFVISWPSDILIRFLEILEG